MTNDCTERHQHLPTPTNPSKIKRRYYVADSDNIIFGGFVPQHKQSIYMMIAHADLQELSHHRLRGASSGSQLLEDVELTLRAQTSRLLASEDDYVIVEHSFAFQISMSVVLGLIALFQMGLIVSFVYHRSKRVLEFAQPLVIGAMVGAGLGITAACYLFVYISNVGCALRQPIIFLFISIIGATVAGKKHRILYN